MRDLSSALFPVETPPILAVDQTSINLCVQALQHNMQANFEQHLRELVFCNSREPVGTKLEVKYRRTISTGEAAKILSLLWKESDFVTEAALRASGLGIQKSYSGVALTAHSLAVDLAETPQQVSKLNSSIRSIALSAANYGLVHRNSVNTTKVILRGSKNLHAFMSQVNTKNIAILTELMPHILATVDSAAASGERGSTI